MSAAATNAKCLDSPFIYSLTEDTGQICTIKKKRQLLFFKSGLPLFRKNFFSIRGMQPSSYQDRIFIYFMNVFAEQRQVLFQVLKELVYSGGIRGLFTCHIIWSLYIEEKNLHPEQAELFLLRPYNQASSHRDRRRPEQVTREEPTHCFTARHSPSSLHISVFII